MSALQRLLAVGRWRWTPFIGLSAGCAVLVAGLTLLVPDRIGPVLAPPPRRPAPLLPANTTDSVEDGSEIRASSAPTAPAPARPTPVARNERRRGFSPVIRSDEPPERAAPQANEEPAATPDAEPPPPPEPVADPERERWVQGQRIASRSATRASMRAAALAGRAARARANEEQTPPEALPEAAAPPEDGEAAPEQPAEE